MFTHIFLPSFPPERLPSHSSSRQTEVSSQIGDRSDAGAMARAQPKVPVPVNTPDTCDQHTSVPDTPGPSSMVIPSKNRLHPVPIQEEAMDQPVVAPMISFIRPRQLQDRYQHQLNIERHGFPSDVSRYPTGTVIYSSKVSL